MPTSSSVIARSHGSHVVERLKSKPRPRRVAPQPVEFASTTSRRTVPSGNDAASSSVACCAPSFGSSRSSSMTRVVGRRVKLVHERRQGIVGRAQHVHRAEQHYLAAVLACDSPGRRTRRRAGTACRGQRGEVADRPRATRDGPRPLCQGARTPRSSARAPRYPLDFRFDAAVGMELEPAHRAVARRARRMRCREGIARRSTACSRTARRCARRSEA